MAFVDRNGDEVVAWTGGEAGPRDYLMLLKPTVMSLVVFTALVGIVLAPGDLHPVLALVALVCITIGAGASGALNQWYDADIDAVMGRTAKRPIPAGKIAPEEALAFGMALSVGSVLTLGVAVNWFAAAFLAFTIFFYAVVYSMWLKRSTPQNIVIGGAAGAFPPMIGWASVTGGLAWESFALFLVIFLWTPPHFWALAILKTEDYARAGVPMMPVVKGAARTRLEILVYSALLVPAGMLPWFMGFAGPVYGVVACGLGLWMLVHAVRVWRLGAAPEGKKAAGKLFGTSIFYLFLLFAALLAEHLAIGLLG